MIKKAIRVFMSKANSWLDDIETSRDKLTSLLNETKKIEFMLKRDLVSLYESEEELKSIDLSDESMIEDVEETKKVVKEKISELEKVYDEVSSSKKETKQAIGSISARITAYESLIKINKRHSFTMETYDYSGSIDRAKQILSMAKNKSKAYSRLAKKKDD